MTTQNDKRFEERMRKADFHVYGPLGMGIDTNKLIAFIRQEILKAVEGERERLVREICVCREPMPSANANPNYNRGLREGVEMMRNDAIQIITNRKQHGTGDKEVN